MNKEDAVALLVEKKYDASIADGVVVVRSAERSDFEKIKKILKKAGYNDSYGWKKSVN